MVAALGETALPGPTRGFDPANNTHVLKIGKGTYAITRVSRMSGISRLVRCW